MNSVLSTDPAARVVAAIGRSDPDFGVLRAVLQSADWIVLEMDGDPTAVEKLNAICAAFPHESFYGTLMNDMVLKVPGTLTALADAVPRGGLSYADDGLQGRAIATAPCVCGELVRAQGWFMNPKARHNGADIYLMQVAHLFGGCTFVQGFGFDHNHYTRGRSPDDETYRLARECQEQDRQAFVDWEKSDLRQTVLRVQRYLPRKGVK